VNKSLEYKLDTPEIMAFVIGVVVIIATNRIFFRLDSYELTMAKVLVLVGILSFFATLFGPVAGGLIGVLGIICSYAICSLRIDFADSISYAVYGCLLGQFASSYYIREGNFKIKQVVLWNLTNMFSLIAAFIFVKPFLQYIFYNIDLIENLVFGMKMVLLSSVILGVILSIVFFVTSSLAEYVKK